MDHLAGPEASKSVLARLTFRLAQVTTRAWTLAFAIYAYVATTVSAAWFIRRGGSASDPVGFLESLQWSGALYLVWLPTGLVVWFVLSALGPGPRGLVVLGGTTVAAAVTGALWSSAVSMIFGGGPLEANVWAESALSHAPVALLLSTAVSLVGLAATHRDLATQARAEVARLRSALDSARVASIASPDTGQARLLVAVGRRRVSLDPREVEHFASAANYVVVHWSDREGLIREALGALEERLDPKIFARCHRSTIVNLARVAEAVPLADGAWRLTLASGAEVIASRSYRDEILRRLGR